MKTGVVDFIEKPFEPSRLIETIKGCLHHMSEFGAAIERRADIKRCLARLTARERQVFDALARGSSNKQIAADLDISPRTVEVFRAKVMTKMEADSLSALMRMSVDLGGASLN